MEGQSNTTSLIAIGTLLLISTVIFFIAFIIYYKRKMYANQMLINILDNECKKEIAELKREIEKLKVGKVDKV